MLTAHSYLTLCDLWIVVHQATLSVGFSGQQFWRGLPCPPSSGGLPCPPDPGIELTFPVSPTLQADSLLLSHQGSPKKNNKKLLRTSIHQ